MMKVAVMLVMHGSPPRDFPQDERSEFSRLASRLRHASPHERAELEQRFSELDVKMRNWPRTPENDPYWAGSQELAEQLAQVSGFEVFSAFNEFCAPTVELAFDKAVEAGAQTVIAVTPMTTRGSSHAERDIPDALTRAQKNHPDVRLSYAWPFDPRAVAQLLADQVALFVGNG
jgi:sirohydrochlorin cobaltochelatase